MTALALTLTDAGRAALVNATHTGSAALVVSQIGVTATAFTPAGSLTALPSEVKRLTTFGGAAVAADTIHISMRDETADAYTLRGFGLYLSDGTLFATYGQSASILDKSAAALLLLAVDVKLSSPSATSITFGNADFLNPPATEAVKGVLQLATAAEVIAATEATKAVTPAGLKAGLDDRLGAAAPTTFIKSLLAAASAAAARGIIGFTWSNLPGVPGSFTPSAHSHVVGDVTGLQAALDAKAPLVGLSVVACTAGSGSVVAPAWARRASVRCWGGGGHGGGSVGAGYGGGGAGAGGYADGQIAVTGGASYACAVGGGGTSSGAYGGTTSFAGGAIYATGGQPGTDSSYSSVGISGLNGYGGGGALNSAYGGGGAGTRTSGGAGAAAAGGGCGGATGPTVPNDGGFPGGGGGGYGPDAAGSGSVGAAGVLIIEWLP